MTYYDHEFSLEGKELDVLVQRSDQGGSALTVRWKQEEDETLARWICVELDKALSADVEYKRRLTHYSW